MFAVALIGGYIGFACVDSEGTSATPCFDDVQCPIGYECRMNYCLPASGGTLSGDGDGDSGTSASDPETGTPGDGDPDTGDGDPDTGDGDPDSGDGDPDSGDGDPDSGDGDGDPCQPGTLGCACDAGVCAPGLVCSEDYICVSGSCGDGVIMGNEECEGNNLQGASCVNLGFEGGTLSCDPVTCQYDTSNCSDTTCGNGVLDIGEQCDGNNLSGFTCADLGYVGGLLACDPVTCTFDASGCINDNDGGGTG